MNKERILEKFKKDDDEKERKDILNAYSLGGIFVFFVVVVWQLLERNSTENFPRYYFLFSLYFAGSNLSDFINKRKYLNLFFFILFIFFSAFAFYKMNINIIF